MVWLSDGEKISKTCLFVLTWSTNMTDKRTDKHRMTAVAVLMHIIARQKWENETFVADSSVILFHTIISKLGSPRTAHLAPHRLHTFMAQNYFYFFWSWNLMALHQKHCPSIAKFHGNSYNCFSLILLTNKDTHETKNNLMSFLRWWDNNQQIR